MQAFNTQTKTQLKDEKQSVANKSPEFKSLVYTFTYKTMFHFESNIICRNEVIWIEN